MRQSNRSWAHRSSACAYKQSSCRSYACSAMSTHSPVNMKVVLWWKFNFHGVSSHRSCAFSHNSHHRLVFFLLHRLGYFRSGTRQDLKLFSLPTNTEDLIGSCLAAFHYKPHIALHSSITGHRSQGPTQILCLIWPAQYTHHEAAQGFTTRSWASQSPFKMFVDIQGL